MYKRNLLKPIETALTDTPVVLIIGARQVGKTTLALSLADNYLTFDDAGVVAAAKQSPKDFIKNLSKPIILDEIGELPSNLQAKLLKVVEEKNVTRVGSNRARQLNVRIIYATHRDLNVLREDFRYRVTTAHAIQLKPLRERRDEIVPLARLFLLDFSQRCGRNVRVSDATLKLLEVAEWRGNVRELCAFVEKWCLDALFAAECEQKSNSTIELTEELLCARLSNTPAPQHESARFLSDFEKFPPFKSGDKMEEYLEEIEIKLLKKAMQENNNNQTHAARELGLSRGGLIKKK
jgi:transcriptional regulator with GAF, ATPase, and Fis domain